MANKISSTQSSTKGFFVPYTPREWKSLEELNNSNLLNNKHLKMAFALGELFFIIRAGHIPDVIVWLENQAASKKFRPVWQELSKRMGKYDRLSDWLAEEVHGGKRSKVDNLQFWLYQCFWLQSLVKEFYKKGTDK